MNPISELWRRTPPTSLPDPSPVASVPLRKIAATGASAAAAIVAVSAVSAATSALRRRVELR
jgi:hypothetical protein